MRSGARQRSPGAMARAAEAADDSANVSFSADTEDFTQIAHPPDDDPVSIYEAKGIVTSYIVTINCDNIIRLF